MKDTFNYLDLLALAQGNRDIDGIVNLVCSKLKRPAIIIETISKKVEHIFLPAYCYEERLVDLYATPENITDSKGKECMFAEILSRICAQVGLRTVLADLRAGISEYSSTFPLDPRIKKYFISSTSTQSIRGTQFLSRCLLKGLNITAGAVLPEIFLNMIPDALSREEKSDISAGLFQCYGTKEEVNELPRFTNSVVTELPFASELIHLTSLQQIFQGLTGRRLYLKLRGLVRQNYKDAERSVTSVVTKESHEETLTKISRMTSVQLIAESNMDFDILMTTLLKYPSWTYSDTIPATMVMGAKGPGRTLLCRKTCDAMGQTAFYKSTGEPINTSITGLFLPVTTSRNIGQLTKVLQKRVGSVNEKISGYKVGRGIFPDNPTKIEREKNQITDWLSFQGHLLANSVGPQFTTLQKVNQVLKVKNQRIIFLIDDLGDILAHISMDENEQPTIRAPCQDIAAQVIARYPHPGIIVFIQRNMALSVVDVSFKQSHQANGQAELKWSSNGALRLMVRLVSKVDPKFYEDIYEIDQTSQNVIKDVLERLWGKKLGKTPSSETYSSRWILTALSDFNG